MDAPPSPGRLARASEVDAMRRELKAMSDDMKQVLEQRQQGGSPRSPASPKEYGSELETLRTALMALTEQVEPYVPNGSGPKEPARRPSLIPSLCLPDDQA